MEPSYNFPQDDYALAILTHAAMQTNRNQTPTTSNSNSAYDRSAAPSSTLTGAEVRDSSATSMISNHSSNLDTNRNRDSRVVQSQPQDILSYTSVAPSSHSMETLTFNPAHAGRHHSYMGPTYQGIGSQISQNYAQTLGILNAESYDDGRAQQRSREMRLKQTAPPDPLLQFGMIERQDEGRTDSDELEKGSRRRKKHKIEHQNQDDEEEARKKARGRPRVDTKDETAADRRRTQIRMAQRAYRHRKETTISSLEKQVQDLRGTNEEMSNIFISLYDFAVSKGLLQREPEFGQQLQSTTERFLALAKSTANDEENQDEHSKDGKSEPESGRKPKKARTSPEKVQEPEPLSSQPWGGYFEKSESPVEEIQPQYMEQQSYAQKNYQRDLEIITRPTEDNASFPFDLMDLQTYRVDVPPVENFMQDFYSEAQLPLPDTHNYAELSFARRIQRGAAERAFKLITAKNPPQKRFQEVFGFRLMYESRESIKEKLTRQLSATTNDSLNNWKAPFVHVGGAGTFYPMHDSNVNEELMPKFRTGYSMGPFSLEVAPMQEKIPGGMRLTLPGYEGEWFDPNDVEGYLRGRGLEIPPSADYITAELDLAFFGEVGSPHSDSTVTTVSPKTPQSPLNKVLGNAGDFSYNFKFAEPEGNAFPFPIGYADWDSNDNVREASNIDPIFNVAPDRDNSSSMPDATATEVPRIEKRLVTVNVKILLESLLDRGVCLGRAPGFRPSDVNFAIIAAVKAGF